MSITSKTGDLGTTSDGLARFRKSPNNPFLMSVGKLDQLGVLLALICEKESNEYNVVMFRNVQRVLILISSGIRERETLPDLQEAIKVAESIIESISTHVTFQGIQPIAGNELSLLIHLARTVTREAELHVWEAIRFQEGKRSAGVFLNRLSDLLYMLAEECK